jgi:hypothetical protein
MTMMNSFLQRSNWNAPHMYERDLAHLNKMRVDHGAIIASFAQSISLRCGTHVSTPKLPDNLLSKLILAVYTESCHNDFISGQWPSISGNLREPRIGLRAQRCFKRLSEQKLAVHWPNMWILQRPTGFIRALFGCGK